MNNLPKLSTRLSTNLIKINSHQQFVLQNQVRLLSISARLNTFEADQWDKIRPRYPEPKRWPKYNEVVKPPVPIDSHTKPRAEFFYYRDNVKYSPKKMWYICGFVRGLTVDEAVKQLSFIPSKGAQIAKEVILEAQEKALDHGFEYKSNMFIGSCFCTKAMVIKGQRKHARYRMGEIRYFHLHFYVKLTEGPPPKEFYYDPNPKTGKEKLDKFIKDHRDKKIEWTLWTGF